MIDFSMTDKAVVKELGMRLKQYRLNKNLSQQLVAERAGISRTAVQGAEKGETSLITIVRILRVLGRLDSLESFLPEPEISPVALAKMQGQKRKKASGKRK